MQGLLKNFADSSNHARVVQNALREAEAVERHRQKTTTWLAYKAKLTQVLLGAHWGAVIEPTFAEGERKKLTSPEYNSTNVAMKVLAMLHLYTHLLEEPAPTHRKGKRGPESYLHRARVEAAAAVMEKEVTIARWQKDFERLVPMRNINTTVL